MNCLISIVIWSHDVKLLVKKGYVSGCVCGYIDMQLFTSVLPLLRNAFKNTIYLELLYYGFDLWTCWWNLSWNEAHISLRFFLDGGKIDWEPCRYLCTYYASFVHALLLFKQILSYQKQSRTSSKQCLNFAPTFIAIG